jgi:hypothetical protein
MKGLSSENIYVNVTWSLGDNNTKGLSGEMFMWMLHEVLAENNTKWSSKENVYVNVTWSLGDK